MLSDWMTLESSLAFGTVNTSQIIASQSATTRSSWPSETKNCAKRDYSNNPLAMNRRTITMDCSGHPGTHQPWSLSLTDRPLSPHPQRWERKAMSLNAPNHRSSFRGMKWTKSSSATLLSAKNTLITASVKWLWRILGSSLSTANSSKEALTVKIPTFKKLLLVCSKIHPTTVIHSISMMLVTDSAISTKMPVPKATTTNATKMLQWSKSQDGSWLKSSLVRTSAAASWQMDGTEPSQWPALQLDLKETTSSKRTSTVRLLNWRK